MEQSKANNIMNNPEDWLSRETASMILHEARNHSKRNWLILYTLLRTGRRISELLRIKPQDIRQEENLILWTILKKRRPLRKWKSIDGETLAALNEYIEQEQIPQDQYIFSSPYNKEKPLSRQFIWKLVKRYAKILELDVHPHSFRHTFSIWTVEKMDNPGDLKMLKDHLEHNSIQTTEAYLQFSTKRSKELLERTFNPVVITE
jgi:integrase/recombinase XerD